MITMLVFLRCVCVYVCACGCGVCACVWHAYLLCKRLGSHEMGRYKLPIIIVQNLVLGRKGTRPDSGSGRKGTCQESGLGQEGVLSSVWFGQEVDLS